MSKRDTTRKYSFARVQLCAQIYFFGIFLATDNFTYQNSIERPNEKYQKIDPAEQSGRRRVSMQRTDCDRGHPFYLLSLFQDILPHPPRGIHKYHTGNDTAIDSKTFRSTVKRRFCCSVDPVFKFVSFQYTYTYIFTYIYISISNGFPRRCHITRRPSMDQFDWYNYDCCRTVAGG